MTGATRRKTISIALVGGGIAFTNFVFLAILPLFIQERFGWQGRELAILLFFSAGSAVLTQACLMKPLLTFVREEVLLQLALVLLCVGTFGFGFVSSATIASCCYVVFLTAFAAANSVLGGLLARCAEQGSRASLFGYYNSIKNLAQVAGPILAAVAFEEWGIEYAITTAAVVAVVAASAGLSILPMFAALLTKKER